MNYTIIGLVLAAIIVLIAFLIRRNKKDEKEFTTGLTRSELKPEKHEDGPNL
ncbi:FeoB-associated Cys-rich membrane protein [Hufsiella ginkgonis]|uniref:FeoB-associated Cys-rich membrane protein n=1 Tax=Hufsiella ginkgonis TaxID=2695274 RepID=UPI001926FD42|nr:FeoB-associated Cys-rich membrane protein [Hufsiella ginkgonis]